MANVQQINSMLAKINRTDFIEMFLCFHAIAAAHTFACVCRDSDNLLRAINARNYIILEMSESERDNLRGLGMFCVVSAAKHDSNHLAKH